MIILRERVIEIPWNKEKYESQDNLLKYAIDNDVSGIMLVDRDTKDLVGYIGWKDDWIMYVEVCKNYRGLGYGNVLMKKALEHGCTGLCVNEFNEPAINLYKKYNFVPTEKAGNKINMRLIC